MKVIDKIIKYYEQEAIDFALGGSDEEAERAKGIASKYTEMKYNGHMALDGDNGLAKINY